MNLFWYKNEPILVFVSNLLGFLWILGRFLWISIKIALGFMKIAALGGDFNESQCDFDGNFGRNHAKRPDGN